MLRFFSKIRKSLLDEGKAARYTKYAIGEIFLVVIGILIALYINGQFNQYQERKVEKEILFKLHSELESDYQQLKTAIEDTKKYIEIVKGFKQAIFADDEKAMIRYIMNNYGGAQFIRVVSSNITFEEMISSGKLYNLSNELLTSSCIAYYKRLERYSQALQQSRSEFRAVFHGGDMNEYWLLYLQDDKTEEDVMKFIKDKESKVYKLLKQTSGWGLLNLEGALIELEALMEQNRKLTEIIKSEVEMSP